MRLRRRASSHPSDHDPISSFWAWWSATRSAALHAVETGDYGNLPDELSARVHAIDRGLEWEFSAGNTARHALTVSAAGVSALRPLTQRWLLAAPAGDADWEYRPARGASWSPGDVVTINGHRVVTDELLVASTPNARGRIDVELWNPAMAPMSPDQRLQLAYLSLDWLLGEDVVEQWIGVVEVAGAAPDSSRPGSELPAIVEAHAADADPDSWILMQGGSADRPQLALVRSPQPRFEDLLRTDHIEAVLPFREQNEGGLPVGESLTALRAFEDATENVHEGVVVLVGHETSAGYRIFHWYARDGAAAMKRLSPVVNGWAEGKGRITTSTDPGWACVSHLR